METTKMNYKEINSRFKEYCFKNNCKVKIVGDFAYKNRNRIIRYIGFKNGCIKIYDSKKGYVALKDE